MVLLVVVGVVLAGKNRNSGEKTAVISESTVDTTTNNIVEKQTWEAADTDVQEPEKPVSETAKAEEKESGFLAKADLGNETNSSPKTDAKPNKKTTVKPVTSKKEVPKPVAETAQPKAVPKNLPKMIELGAEKCVPCKMMKPIIEELQKDYKDKIEVVFIDVWKDNSAAEKYGIQSIPTQVFLDENGKEFFRHTGFFSKEDILKTFEDHGIKLK